MLGFFVSSRASTHTWRWHDAGVRVLGNARKIGLLILLLSALVACGDDGNGDGDGGGDAGSPGTSEAPAPEECVTDVPTIEEGYAAPGSVLCLGTTARVPVHMSEGRPDVAFDLTITSVEPSEQPYEQDPEHPASDYDVYLVHYEATPQAPVPDLTYLFTLQAGVWAADEDAVDNVLAVGPPDCEAYSFDTEDKVGVARQGCFWRYVAKDAEVLGAAYQPVFHDSYQSADGAVRWALPPQP